MSVCDSVNLYTLLNFSGFYTLLIFAKDLFQTFHHDGAPLVEKRDVYKFKKKKFHWGANTQFVLILSQN